MTTSAEAWLSVQKNLSSLRRLIVSTLLRYPEGLNQDEIVEEINRFRTGDYIRGGSLRPRVTELVDKGLVVPAGHTRTAASGREQEVWRLRRDNEMPVHRTIRRLCPSCGRK